MFIGVSPGRFKKMHASLPGPRMIDRIKVWDAYELEPFRQGEGHPLAICEAPQTSGIYIVGFHGYIKIGWSDNIRTRLKSLQQALPETLLLHATMPGSVDDERALHRRFSEYSTRGEWFRRCGELVAFIAELSK